MKTLFGIIAAAFLLLGAYNVAKADDCQVMSLNTFVETMVKAPGTEVIPVNDADTKLLLEKKGRPPHVKGDDFRFLLAANVENNIGLIAVVEGECIQDTLGPADLDSIKAFLGHKEANNGT